MPELLKLLMPVDAPYDTLGPDLARKCVQIAGGSARDVGEAADALSGALSRTTKGAAPDAEVAITMEVDADRVVMHVRCGSESATVTQPIPVRKS